MAFNLDTETAIEQSQNMDVSVLTPLRPCLIGPMAALHRYSVAAEKALISLGSQDFGIDEDFTWPAQTSGSLVDLDSVQVYLDDCLLNYLNDYVGAGSAVEPVSNYPNRVRAAGQVFKTANGTSRSAALYDRDVTVGDTVYVRGTIVATAYSLWSQVTGLAYEAVASVVGSITEDANNQAAIGAASASISQVDGTPINDVEAAASAASYSSLADGYVTRTYTVTVTQSSTGGDATTALLRVTSADGLDDDDDVVPAAFSSPTDIGSKGLTVTFSINASKSSSVSGYSEQDLVVGQQWTITCSQAFTKASRAAGGTYSGPTDTVLKVEVTRGGYYTDASPPQITVSSTTGLPGSGPHNVTASGLAVSIGAYTPAVTVTFTGGTGLRKGDIYYITCTAASEGACRTLILANDLTTAVDDDGNTGDLTAAADLDLRLFIKKQGVSLSADRTYPTISTNWSADQDYFTLESGLYLYDSTFTDGGVPQPLPVTSATVYVQYREWVFDQAGQLLEFSARSSLAATLGTVDPTNPIAYAADLALQNTAGNLLTNPAQDTGDVDTVRVVVLGADPTALASWTDALNLIASDESGTYYLVPLTQDATIHSAIASHVASMSTSAVSGFRACLLSASVTTAAAIVNSTKTSDLTAALGVVEQNPRVTSTAYTQLRVPAGNAKFITNGVVAGDKVRYLYTVDALGDEAYSEYTVSSVISEDTILLSSGPSAAYSQPQRVEVWRNYTKDQLVTQLTTKSASYASERVCYVWPDTIEVGGTSLYGYFLCAAIAGAAGSIPSHQPLRHVALQGFTTANRSNKYFTAAQLDTLGAGGVMVVTANADGQVYIRQAVTTDTTSVGHREEMVRRNADMVRFYILDQWSEYIGSANLTDDVLRLMQGKVMVSESYLQSRCTLSRIGSPVVSLAITSIAQSETAADHAVATLSLTGPYPNNKTELTLVVN